MAAETRNYAGVTREMFDRLRESLERLKVSMPQGDAGTVSSNGLTAAYLYDAGSNSLSLTIEKSPLFVPRPLIWKAVDDAVAGARPSS